MEGYYAEDSWCSAVGSGEEVECETILKYAYSGVSEDLVAEAVDEFFTCGIAICVEDAEVVVSAFTPPEEFTCFGVGVEAHSPVTELGDFFLCVFDDGAYGGKVAEACSGGDGVLDMLFNGIVGGCYGCDSTLCESG